MSFAKVIGMKKAFSLATFLIDISMESNAVGVTIFSVELKSLAQPSMVSLMQEIMPQLSTPPVATPLKVRVPLNTASRYLKLIIYPFV